MRINTYKIVKAEYFYECESDNLCINMYTPPKRMMGRGNIQNVYIIFLLNNIKKHRKSDVIFS